MAFRRYPQLLVVHVCCAIVNGIVHCLNRSDSRESRRGRDSGNVSIASHGIESSCICTIVLLDHLGGVDSAHLPKLWRTLRCFLFVTSQSRYVAPYCDTQDLLNTLARITLVMSLCPALNCSTIPYCFTQF